MIPGLESRVPKHRVHLSRRPADMQLWAAAEGDLTNPAGVPAIRNHDAFFSDNRCLIGSLLQVLRREGRCLPAVVHSD